MKYTEFFSKHTCYWCNRSLTQSNDLIEYYCFNRGCRKYIYWEIGQNVSFPEINVKFKTDALPVIQIYKDQIKIYATQLPPIAFPFDYSFFEDRSKLYTKVQTLINFA